MLKMLSIIFLGAISVAAQALDTPAGNGGAPAPAAQPEVKVLMQTNMGDIELALWPDKAPLSVANFLKYVNDGFYDGVVFHRVINGFMIQGGGFDSLSAQRPPKYAPIKNEADNHCPNNRGTIAMARTNEVNSATAQFFINVNNNEFLNYQNPQQYGYAVFGTVTKGMDVVDKIKAVPTGTNPKWGMPDWPKTNVIIEKVTVVGADK